MFCFGFSTGALAPGDFRRALELLPPEGTSALELSALRDHELPELMGAARELPLRRFRYVSVHAPSHRAELSEKEVAEMLLPCLDLRWHVVLHPDAIEDPACWRAFGGYLCIENMDKRKRTGRTAGELRPFFEALPEASLCLDLAHARQIDPTLGVARFILAELGGRLAQVHLSELDGRSQHAPLSMTSVAAFQTLAHWIRPVPVILEARLEPEGLAEELRLARLCFAQGETAAAPVR